jgi:hypothetical protein
MSVRPPFLIPQLIYVFRRLGISGYTFPERLYAHFVAAVSDLLGVMTLF